MQGKQPMLAGTDLLSLIEGCGKAKARQVRF